MTVILPCKRVYSVQLAGRLQLGIFLIIIILINTHSRQENLLLPSEQVLVSF